MDVQNAKDLLDDIINEFEMHETVTLRTDRIKDIREELTDVDDDFPAVIQSRREIIATCLRKLTYNHSILSAMLDKLQHFTSIAPNEIDILRKIILQEMEQIDFIKNPLSEED